jgi:hypothetical protein
MKLPKNFSHFELGGPLTRMENMGIQPAFSHQRIFLK